MPPTFHSPSGTRTLRIALPILTVVAFILVTSLVDGGKGVVPSALWHAPDWAPWWHAPLRLFCNALPGLMVGGIVLALTRRLGLAAVVALALEVLVYVVNALKMRNLGAPLLPADFLMVGQLAGGGVELLAGYLPRSPWPYLGILGFIAVIVLLARWERPFLRRSWWLRGTVALVLAVALGSLVAGWSAWNVVYHSGRLGMQPWSPKATTAHTGLISSLLLFHLKYGGEHDKPDVDAALALLREQYQAVHRREQAIAETAGADSKPDIVIILSESLFDPGILKGYDEHDTILPNLHRLSRHATAGLMHVPTFGGGTIRTGFEVLTGLSLRYFDDIQFPWLQINQKRIPGIVRLLKSRGYETLAVHGNDPAFWNRTSAFRKLGFDRFVSIDDFAPENHVNDGKYLSDKSFTSELLAQLKDAGPPRFVYGLSIEAHGPYDKPYDIDLEARDAMPVPDSITGDHRKHLQNYLYHIHHADQELGRLIDALDKRQRRTIVVFFGDHLPALVPAFQDAGFKDGKGFLVQKVPYIIYDTAHPDAPAEQRTVASWMLPGMALAKAGIRDDGYYALTDILGPKLADLTRAPDAPRPKPTPEQETLETGMRNVARLRLEGKLAPLWDEVKAAAPAASTPAPATTAMPATAASAPAGHLENPES